MPSTSCKCDYYARPRIIIIFYLSKKGGGLPEKPKLQKSELVLFSAECVWSVSEAALSYLTRMSYSYHVNAT